MFSFVSRSPVAARNLGRASLAAIGAVLLLAATPGTSAAHHAHNHRGGHHGGYYHGGYHGGHWRAAPYYAPRVYAPSVYYAPPRVYYAPPPAYYPYLTPYD